MVLGILAITGIAKAPKISEIPGETKNTPSPTAKPSVAPINPTGDELKLVLKGIALQYGQDFQKMSAVINCESGWDVSAYNKDDEKFVKGGSRGIAQFTIPTFKQFCAGDYGNPIDQLACMGLLWQKHQQNRWSCYRNLYGG